MPTYVYKFVDTGETIEVQQAFTEDALTEVPDPNGGTMRPVRKVFTPVGITFKGNGFYKTDNRGRSSAGSGGSSAAKSDSSSSSESSSSSSDSGSSGSGKEAASSSSASASKEATPHSHGNHTHTH
jgi:predicted nucleic acid-binding Zn ribbon protein